MGYYKHINVQIIQIFSSPLAQHSKKIKKIKKRYCYFFISREFECGVFSRFKKCLDFGKESLKLLEIVTAANHFVLYWFSQVIYGRVKKSETTCQNTSILHLLNNLAKKMRL